MKPQKQAQLLPEEPGVYQFYDQKNQLIYVGKAKNLKRRVGYYFSRQLLGPKTDLMVTKIKKINFIKVFSEFEALLLESELIRKHQPFFNAIAKDDKSPIYIEITSGPIPLIMLKRKTGLDKNIFVKGPFPSTKVARHIARIIRKIFPFCHHQNPGRPCLYVNLGLCPYPYDPQNKKVYLANINRIKMLLSGKITTLTKTLTKQMNQLSNNQRYEEAGNFKNQLQKLEYLVSTYHTPQDFLERPTLVDDLTLLRLGDLKKALDLSKLPRRIECYDISNIGGKLATGSMVVYQNGAKAPHEYRRFRVKFTQKPNDYQMLTEVLARRLKNDWPTPDLIIIDGGRGQLNTALRAINQRKLNIPVVSLAKRFEEIYVPGKILPITLPKESPARQLAQAARDEAHRFAISYHKLLRSRDLLDKNK